MVAGEDLPAVVAVPGVVAAAVVSAALAVEASAAVVLVGVGREEVDFLIKEFCQ